MASKENNKEEEVIEDFADVEEDVNEGKVADDSSDDDDSPTPDAVDGADDQDVDEDSPDETDSEPNAKNDEEEVGGDSADIDTEEVEDKPSETENNEVAAKSELIFNALSDSNEDYHDDTHLEEFNSVPMDKDWESLMGEYIKAESKSVDDGKRGSRKSNYALESLNLSSFGFVTIKKILDDEARHIAKQLIVKLPEHLNKQVQNCLVLVKQNLININDLIKTFQDRINSKKQVISSFTWGGYSRRFMCAGVSIDTMEKLLSVTNQQMAVHQHLSRDGVESFIANASAVRSFLASTKDDSKWDSNLKILGDRLLESDKRLEVSQEYLIRRTDPTTYVPRAPRKLRNRKPDTNGMALVSMLDSTVYCRHTPASAFTNLSQLISFGVSVERDEDSDKNPNSGIDHISDEQVLSLLITAKKTLEAIKLYEINLVRMLGVLNGISKQYAIVGSYSDYNLSIQKREELLYVGIYLTEMVTNPHIVNMWQAMCMVHACQQIANQILPQELVVYNNFEGFKMKQTKFLVNALEQMNNVVDETPVDIEKTVEIGEVSGVDGVLDGMDVHPEDQRVIDEGKDLAEQSSQVTNSVMALEGLRQSCQQMIKYGVPSEQRLAISSINSNHKAICMGLGIKSPPMIANESVGGEVAALEGIFSAIGETIGNIIQSVKNMWNNWIDKIQENKLRAKAAAGNMHARVELIRRKKHLLAHCAGQTYTNKNTIANLGLYGKLNTPKLALEAAHNLHADYAEYIHSSLRFTRNFYASIGKVTTNEIRQSIADDIYSFEKIVFTETKNPHAVAPRLIKDQRVRFTKPIPGNGVMAIIMPNELFNESYRGDKIDEVRVTDLSSGIRRDSVTQINAATEDDFNDVVDAIDRWIALVDASGYGWENLIAGANNAKDLANKIYNSITANDADATDAALMFYHYLGNFLPQVLNGLNIRSALTQTTFAASFTWLEESILKAEEIIKSNPSVGTSANDN